MKQEKINYSDVMALGFTEEIVKDSVYYNRYGYDSAIINKYLTKKIYLDWEKDKRTCKIVRIDSPKTGNIMSKSPVMNLQHLKDIIIFFCDKKQQDFDLIFEEEFKAGIKQVNNVVLDDVIKCDCKLEKHERAKMELDYNKCMDCKKPIG